MKGRSQRLRPVLDPPAHLRPLLGLGHTHATHVAPQPADLTAVWMRMEWGKCRADTRSSHREHVHRIALDTERKGRVPWPIRPPADPRLDTRNLPALVLARKSCAPCTRAPGITSRAARRAQLHAPPAPSSRPLEVVAPVKGQEHHGSRSPAHTRAGECRASVGSRGRRAHQASSTCAGRSRRATAWRSSPATPPAPDGEPPGRRTPSAAHPPAFPPDLDLRRHPRVSCRHPASHPPGGVRGLSGNDSSSTAVR